MVEIVNFTATFTDSLPLSGVLFSESHWLWAKTGISKLKFTH